MSTSAVNSQKRYLLTLRLAMLLIALGAVCLAAWRSWQQYRDGDRAVTSVLIRALGSDDVVERRAAASQLGAARLADLGRVLPALIAAARDPDVEVQRVATASLGPVIGRMDRSPSSPTPAEIQAAIAELLTLLCSRDTQVRRNAIFSLGRLSGWDTSIPSVLAAVVPRLSDTDQQVFGWAFVFLMSRDWPDECFTPELRTTLQTACPIGLGEWESVHPSEGLTSIDFHEILATQVLLDDGRRSTPPWDAIAFFGQKRTASAEVLARLVEITENQPESAWVIARCGGAARTYVGRLAAIGQRTVGPVYSDPILQAILAIAPDSPEALAYLGPLVRSHREVNHPWVRAQSQALLFKFRAQDVNAWLQDEDPEIRDAARYLLEISHDGTLLAP
jgi:hypothetical protein